MRDEELESVGEEVEAIALPSPARNPWPARIFVATGLVAAAAAAAFGLGAHERSKQEALQKEAQAEQERASKAEQAALELELAASKAEQLRAQLQQAKDESQRAAVERELSQQTDRERKAAARLSGPQSNASALPARPLGKGDGVRPVSPEDLQPRN